jgi:hypothetical protein
MVIARLEAKMRNLMLCMNLFNGPPRIRFQNSSQICVLFLWGYYHAKA